MILRTLKAIRLIWKKDQESALIYCGNLALKIMGLSIGAFKIRGRWYFIRDKGIATLVIYKEIVLGLYDAKPPIGGKVIDVGAHVGLFSIPLARENPLVSFHAIEPDAINFRNLETNLKRNRIKNVTTSRIAIGSHGWASTKHDAWNSGASKTIDGYSVPRIPLKDLGPCDLLKIDIEGGEYDAIQSREDWSQAKELIIEIHDDPRRPAMLEICKGARVILE